MANANITTEILTNVPGFTPPNFGAVDFGVSANGIYSAGYKMITFEPGKILQAQELNEIRLWPNPAEEYIEIDFPRKAGNSYEFSMMDTNGKVLFRCNFRDQQHFPLQGLQLVPGEYLIQIQNHEVSESRRILIK
jgi:hypothetical protein